MQQIAYYRVSTKKQGSSGLGLEAQKALVFGFLREKPDFEFTEVETGTKSGDRNRPQLRLATAKAKEVGGRLVIAKLDRLSRNVHFISGLMENRVNFVCCDNPDATPMVLHILAAVAEQEAIATSQRNKDAANAKRMREFEKGNLDFKFGPKKGNATFSKSRVVKEGERTVDEIISFRRERMIEAYDTDPENIKVRAIIKELFEDGKKQREIADFLNKFGYKTVRGARWSLQAVSRCVNYLGLVRVGEERGYAEIEKEKAMWFQEENQEVA